MLEKKCDVLIVEPVMSDAAHELIQALNATNLPVVLCNRELPEEAVKNCPKAIYVSSDLQYAGATQAKMVLDLPDGGDLNGDGTVSCLMLQGPENDNGGVVWSRAIQETLGEGQLNNEILKICYGDWTTESGRKQCKQELAVYGKDIEVILCGSDQIAYGAVQAISDGGRTTGKDVYLFGLDGEDAVFRMIHDGVITGTVSCDENGQIRAIAHCVMSLLEGKTVVNTQNVAYVPVSSDNVDQYLS